MTDDDALKQALDELSDVARCRCDEAFRDRGLQDPECQCDSMDAVRVVIARIEWLERERVLDAKLLADTQALLDTALEAVIDAKLVAEAKLAQVETTEDVGILRARVDELQRLNADLTRQVQMQPRRPQDAAPATDAVDALVKAAEEAAEVIHKAYVSATMEAVNAGPSHPLKDNIDKWRVRCLRAEEALRAALTTEKTNG